MSPEHEDYFGLDQCLKQRMQAFHTPALVMALTDREQCIRLSGLGYAQLGSKKPVQTDHLFSIGSIGKSFTALAVLQAYEQGLIDLHAPVTAYLPWFQLRSSFPPITIHHLLTHSSGLPGGTEFSPDPRAEVYALRDQEAGFAPGTHISYSDTGYKVLGLVLQSVTGKPYAQIIHDWILAPLAMTNTYAATTSDLRPRMAQGYRGLFDDRPRHISHPLVPADWVETDSADGSILTTAEDLAKFARMLLNQGRGPNGPLLRPDSFLRMVTPQAEDEGETYGYGLYIFDDGDYRVVGHGGDVPGYQSYLWLDLENGLGVIALMTEPYTPRASFLILEYFRAAYLGQPLPDTPPLPDFTHVSNAADYAGKYQGEGCTLTFEALNHHLFLVCGEQRVLLEERNPDCFYANHPAWNLYLLRFERNASQKISEVSYGPRWFAGAHYAGPRTFSAPAEWQAFTGHYRAHNPWYSNFRIFVRKDQLLLAWPYGDEEVLAPLGDGHFRIGEEEYVPERLAFDQLVDGQALRAVRSGCEYFRFFTP